MAIWDKPAGRVGDIESISADSLKCPNCASNLVFDLEHGACICRNCGSLFDPDTLDKVGSFGVECIEKSYDADAEMSGEDGSRIEVVCNSCGAQIITDRNTSSTFCAFCGSPALLTRRLTREFRPDYIIPFKFDKEKAISIFEEHCAGVDHLPKDFSSAKVLSKMTGLYVPTWIVSTEVESDVRGFGYTGKFVDHTYRNIITDEVGSMQREVYGRVNFRLKDVPFDGEKNIANRLMAAAEPFDFSELVRFRAEYLQGFFAEKYDELPIDMTDVIYRRLDKYALSVCSEITFGFDTFEPISQHCVTKYKNQDIKYALLPVWFLSVEYNGRRYQYIVNGQTGKVSGEFPYAKGWETIEQKSRRSKLNAVQRNKILRGLLIMSPFTVFIVFMACFGVSEKGMIFMFYHPVEFLIIAATVALATFVLAKMVPKLLFKKEQNDIEKLSVTSSHDLAPEPGAEAYYDSTFPITAVETNSNFVTLESGWKYGEMAGYVRSKVEHDIEEQEEVGEDATEFEKQGWKRKMMQ